jgi:hypothetical protein
MTSITGRIRGKESAQAAKDFGRLWLKVGTRSFLATWEIAMAPRTCTLFRKLLPMRAKIIHCSWSGEGVWVPLGKGEGGWHNENETSHPEPGQLLLYMGDRSEPEFLIPCGCCIFNSKSGILKGNHFATVSEGVDQLLELHRVVLWQGAQDCTIESLSAG